jgi:hypothetical protein
MFEMAASTKQEQSRLRRAPATTLLLFGRSSRQERALSAARVAALGQNQQLAPRCPREHEHKWPPGSVETAALRQEQAPAPVSVSSGWFSKRTACLLTMGFRPLRG